MTQSLFISGGKFGFNQSVGISVPTDWQHKIGD